MASQHRRWKRDYRIPDVCVYLHTNPAINFDTHHVGGPDFLVEVISPGEDPHGKLEYYAEQNTREVLIVERKPWAIELFKLKDGELISSGRSRVENRKVLVSDALDLTFQLKSGPKRPVIELIQPATGVKWTI